MKTLAILSLNNYALLQTLLIKLDSLGPRGHTYSLCHRSKLPNLWKLVLARPFFECKRCLEVCVDCSAVIRLCIAWVLVCLLICVNVMLVRLTLAKLTYSLTYIRGFRQGDFVSYSIIWRGFSPGGFCPGFSTQSVFYITCRYHIAEEPEQPVESVKRKKWEKREEEIVSTRRVPDHMSTLLHDDHHHHHHHHLFAIIKYVI